MHPWGASNASSSQRVPQWGVPGFQGGNFPGTFQPRPPLSWQGDPAQAISMGTDPWFLNGGRGVGGYGDPWRQGMP